MNNYFEIKMPATGNNEAFARSVVAAFAVNLSPTVEEINDLRTAVSEAVTNAVVHAYGESGGIVQLKCSVDDKERSVTVCVTDFGCGISDVDEALEPFFTTRAEDERSGMGFTIMQTFTDELSVHSELGKGTTVTMKKVFRSC